MKSHNAIGFAVIAALAALLGGGTASAETTELFGGSTTLSTGAKISSSLSSGTSALLSDTSGSLADTCNGSTVELGTTNTTGSPGTGSVLNLSWSGCTFTTKTLTNGSLDVTKIAGTNDGTVTGTGSRVTVLVFGFLPCIYGTKAGTHLGSLDGTTSGNAVMSINATIPLVETETFICPETTKWVASYTVTSPTALNVGT